MSNFAVWIRMMRYLTTYRRWAITAFLGILANIALMIMIPTILRQVIDVGIENKDSDYMFKAGLLIVGLGVLRGISGFIYRFFGERLSHYIAYDVRNQVYDKVQNLPFSYHDTAQTGTLITRAISDVDEMQRYFAFGMIDGVNTALLVLGVGVVMVITSPVLAILALAPLIPLAFYSKNFAQKVDPLWKKIMERLQKLGNHIQENSLGAEVIRAFNRESYEVNKFAENNENLYYERIDLIREWGKFIPISVFMVAISSALVLVIGAVMERNQFGGVTIGIIVSFNAYVLLVAQPLRLLGFVILLFTQATSSATRVFEIIDTPIDLQSKPDATELERIDGHVRMNNVSFAYSVDAPPILKDISFEAKPDQVVALLGPTGSGKSTLVNLIPRYYDVTEGQITIDGYNVRDVELSSLRRRIGMVLQSSLLFSATVRENIAYGSPDATDEAVIAAAKAANAHEFIEGFPEGYETLIGERGVTLSGGQRQRVAIARALLINPSILILDDSTSSVDTKTEFLIQEALSRLMRGRTTFIIAQRLNSIQNADLILALDKGKIIERGTHAELLEMNGYYAEVYNLQLADQERVRAELEAVGQTPRKYIDEDKRLATDEFRALFDRIGGGSD